MSNNTTNYSGFSVPYASSYGELVSAFDATKGFDYFCPACESPLVLRKGDKRKAHFAHKPNGNCSGEAALHKIAKKLIGDLILSKNYEGLAIALGCHSSRGSYYHLDDTDFLIGGNRADEIISRKHLFSIKKAPRGEYSDGFFEDAKKRVLYHYNHKKDCGSNCRHSNICLEPITANVFFGVKTVVEEYTLSSGLRPDVALFDNDGILMGIVEVFNTHKVEENKAGYFDSANIPWIELSADNILSNIETGLPLTPIAGGLIRSLAFCGKCSNNILESEKREKIRCYFQQDVQLNIPYNHKAFAKKLLKINWNNSGKIWTARRGSLLLLSKLISMPKKFNDYLLGEYKEDRVYIEKRLNYHTQEILDDIGVYVSANLNCYENDVIPYDDITWTKAAVSIFDTDKPPGLDAIKSLIYYWTGYSKQFSDKESGVSSIIKAAEEEEIKRRYIDIKAAPTEEPVLNLMGARKIGGNRYLLSRHDIDFCIKSIGGGSTSEKEPLKYNLKVSYDDREKAKNILKALWNAEEKRWQIKVSTAEEIVNFINSLF